MEVIIALLLMTLMLLPIALSFALGAVVITGNSLMNQATVVAEGHLEEMRSLGYNTILQHYPPDDPPEVRTEDRFTLATSSDIPSEYSDNLVRVTVQVSWEHRGDEQSLTVQSFVGPQ